MTVAVCPSQSQLGSVTAAGTHGEGTVGFLSRGISEGDAGVSSHFLQQSQCDLGGNCDHTASTITRNRANHQPGNTCMGFKTFLRSKGKGREAINQ